MFSHVTVGVSDLDRAGRFYDGLLAPLGLVQRRVTPDGGPQALCWHDPAQALPLFYAYTPLDGERSTCGNGSMVAFLADSPDCVVLAYDEALRCGGTDDGAPGPRPRYGPAYFGAYVRDPDGNKLHVVCRTEQAAAPTGRRDRPA
ncbi:VOC family protein [Sphingomonas sp. UYAg733]